MLRQAILNTATNRGSMREIGNWASQMSSIRESDYQKKLWGNYQRSFKYAAEISFQESCDVIVDIMERIFLQMKEGIDSQIIPRSEKGTGDYTKEKYSQEDLSLDEIDLLLRS